MKKKYEKPLLVSEKKKETKSEKKPLYLADGRWCCMICR